MDRGDPQWTLRGERSASLCGVTKPAYHFTRLKDPESVWERGIIPSASGERLAELESMLRMEASADTDKYIRKLHMFAESNSCLDDGLCHATLDPFAEPGWGRDLWSAALVYGGSLAWESPLLGYGAVLHAFTSIGTPCIFEVEAPATDGTAWVKLSPPVRPVRWWSLEGDSSCTSKAQLKDLCQLSREQMTGLLEKGGAGGTPCSGIPDS